MGLVQSYISVLKNYKKYHRHALTACLLTLALLQTLLWSHTRTVVSQKENNLSSRKQELTGIETAISKAEVTAEYLTKRLNELNAREISLTSDEILSIKTFVEKEVKTQNSDIPVVRTITRDEYAQEFNSDVQKNAPDKEAANNFKAFLETFGLIDRGLSDDDFIKTLVDSQVSIPVAFYNPADKKLTLIKGVSSSPVYYQYNLAHETTHFIQDKQFGISEQTKTLRKGSSDKYLAYLSLVEGQAEYVAQSYTASLSPQQRQELTSAMRQAALGSKSGKVTQFDLKKNEFVYSSGLNAVSTINDESRINALLQSGNVTSKEILHPEHLGTFKEVQIGITYSRDNYSQKDSDVLGEAECRIMLSNLASEANAPCSLWQGDSFRLYRNENNRIVIYAMVTENEDQSKVVHDAFEQSLTKLGERFSIISDGKIVKVLITNDGNIDTKAELTKVTVNLTNQ